MSQPGFKIVIVGFSVTGLTLAHCLDKLGVEYIILEKRSAIVLKGGTSVAIMPNGGRILDQLGLYDAFENDTVPLDLTDTYLPDHMNVSRTSPRFTSTKPSPTPNRVVLAPELTPMMEGDMAVGADGIHSKTLREMWRVMGEPVFS
ncbi:hypothetical protein PG997_011469 [Apiospora hydei]|uniref:FAD-binding domain-containing protein n=1 Tax=Apiospora hydei TaxID=1337664 RepID=A0ABR1VJ52_9PEZI